MIRALKRAVERLCLLPRHRRALEQLRRAAAIDGFCVRLGDALRPLRSPDEIKGAAARTLLRELQVDRVYYGELEPDGQHILNPHDYHCAGMTRHAIGRYRMQDYSQSVLRAIRAGRPMVVPDVNQIPGDSAAERAAYAAIQVRAFIIYPLSRGDRLVAVFGVIQSTPRRWTEDDLAYVQQAAERTWVAVEHRSAEQQLRRTTERFETALRASPVVVFNQDRDLRYTWIHNPALGYSIEQVLGKRDTDMFSRAAEVAQLETLKRAVLDSGVAQRQEVKLWDGAVLRCYDLTVQPQRDAHGAVIGVICAAVDLTERTQAAEALRRRDEDFRTLADNMSQLAWMADDKGLVFWYNRRWYDYTGTTLEQMQGWGWRAVQHPDHVERVVAGVQRAWDTGEPWEDTFPLRSKDGEYRWFLSRAQPIRDDSGRVVRWFGTNTDITEQRALEEALREQDRRKDEFLAMLAHELRNPLAPILNAVHIQRLSRGADRSGLLIERQVHHLVRLVDDLLDVSRVSRGKIQIERQPLDLGAVAQQAIETSRPLLDARGHHLKVTLPAAALRVSGDFTRLTQVVSNLLNNAAKYTDAGGQIELTLCATRRAEGGAQEAVIRVRDNGRGIDPPVLLHLFELFYQVDRNLDRAEGGLGIGLSLVKRLVEMHGGRVEALSAGRGHGSEFVVCLPLLEADATPVDVAPVDAAPVDAAPGDAAPRSLAAAPDRPAAAGSGLRVLVVDDNRDSTESMATLLRLGGHQVLTAADGRTGVELALRERPHVILLDIGLPQTDGYQACRAIRAGGLDGALVVAMTGYGQEQDRQRSRQAGFDAHVIKPVDWPALQRLLSERGDGLLSACGAGA